MTPELRTERLLLRGWRDEDKLPYSLLNADPDVMRHFPSTLSQQQSDEMVDRMRRTWSERGFGLWAVERLDLADLPDDEIVSFTTTKNLKSQRVMEKIGMRHDPARDFDHPVLPTWHERRHVLYCIDRRTWRAGVAR